MGSGQVPVPGIFCFRICDAARPLPNKKPSANGGLFVCWCTGRLAAVLGFDLGGGFFHTGLHLGAGGADLFIQRGIGHGQDLGG